MKSIPFSNQFNFLNANKIQFIVTILCCNQALQKMTILNTAMAQNAPVSSAPAQAAQTPESQNSNGNFSTTSNTLDAIIVTIGDEPILWSDVSKALHVASDRQTKLGPTGKLSGGAMSTADANALLDQIIDQRVLATKVREFNLTVAEDELDVEIQNFLKNQNITHEKFLELLKQEGETEESHRDEFRTQLETQRFVGRVIRPLVSVTEEEVKNYYLTQNKAPDATQKIKLRSLVIEIPESMNEQNKKAKTELIAKIRKDIDSGSPFVNLVKLYSESPDALKTEGILAAKASLDLPSELRDRIKDLKPDAVVGPLTIGSSTFFFQYLGSENSNFGDFDKQKTTWENKLLEIKFKERLSDYVKAERAKIKIVRRDFKFSK